MLINQGLPYIVLPGTGSNPDYTSSTVTLTFDESNDLQCFDIPIIDDIDLEDNEIFLISLDTDDPDVTLDPRDGSVIIVNDDGKHIPE